MISLAKSRKGRESLLPKTKNRKKDYAENIKRIHTLVAQI